MDLKSINDIFQQRIFRIPTYQRGYAWANNKHLDVTSSDPFKNITGQLRDLWDDIQNINENNWHYTGLLTLNEMDKEYNWLHNHRQYAIVDGQQRITSILILIKILIDRATELGFEYGFRQDESISQYLMIGNQKTPSRAFIFGYDNDNPSDKYFKKYILDSKGLILGDAQESVYTENLKNAKQFFQDCVNLYCKSNITDSEPKELLKSLFIKVTSQLKFNEYVLPKELNQYVVFETMNNRGKSLSDLERLKNRMMYLNDKLSLSSEQYEGDDPIQQEKLLNAQKKELSTSINTSWTTIYQSLGTNKKNPLDDEEFVKNHWIMFFNKYDRSEAKTYANYLFEEYFTIENIYAHELQKIQIEHYAESLQESSIIWNKLNYPDYFSSDESEIENLVRKLHRVGFRASFKPLVMAILLRKDRSDFSQILSLIEEFSFKIFHIADRQSNTGDSKLYRLAYKVYKENYSVDNVRNDIQGHLDYYYNFDLFKNQIDELFTTGERPGYYGWTGLKYFLFEYDLYLRQENDLSTNPTEIVWNDFYAKNSIEHIYPQSAALSFDDYCIRYNKKDKDQAKLEYDSLQEDWKEFRDLPASERWELCNSLGNLLALTSPLNSSLSNDCFKFKVDQSLKSTEHKNKGLKYDSMSAQLVANNSKWTQDTIKNRGIEMIDFLWKKLHNEKTNILNYEDKLSLLGIRFLNKK